MKILDCSYKINFEDGSPIIEIWGVGGKHLSFNDHTPFFYVEMNDHITHDVGMKLLQSKGFYMVKAVTKFRPIGYQEKPRGMFQVFCRSPKDVREAREVAARIPNVFKIYNADVKYKNVWMIDHDTGGMDEFGPVDDSPMKYLGFDIEVLVTGNGKFPVAEEDPIILISMSFSPQYSEVDRIVLTTKDTGYDGCHIIKCEDEVDLLNTFIFLINDYNPDIVAGYNSNAFDFPYIDKRCKILKVNPTVTRDGRSWYIRPRFDGGVDVTITGRVVIDLLPIIRKNYSLNQYTLKEVAKLVKYEKLDMSPKEMREAYLNGDTAESRNTINSTRDTKERSKNTDTISNIRNNIWDSVCAYADRDAELVMRLILDLKIIDKYVALSKASGLLLQDVINGGQSGMIEALLMRKFKAENRVMSMQPVFDDEEEDEIRYEGASVLTPPQGLQKDLAILDFRSLYPTIVIAHNISYDTLLQDDDNGVEYEVSPSGAKFVKSSVKLGIMPDILNTLLNKRIATKKLMKQATGAERDYLDAEQNSYKILLNSFYGYSGYIRARLFTIEVAESVTSYGRTTIESTIQLIRELGYKVVYSDTDSTFVQIDGCKDLDEMKIKAEEIATIASSKLPAPMELLFEAIAKKALFLSKKRYAMWRFEPGKIGWESKLKTKGIATVRRDWCKLTGDTLKTVLDMILINEDILGAAKFAHESILKIKMMDLKTSGDHIQELLLTRRYGGDLQKYKNEPVHINLIKRMMKRGIPEPVSGDRIPFIIINEYSGTFSQKGEDPEFAIQKGYTIDTEYYTSKQLLPPLVGIFEPLGITSSMLRRGIFENDTKKSTQQTLFEL
jgi:DNA polymerase I